MVKKTTTKKLNKNKNKKNIQFGQFMQTPGTESLELLASCCLSYRNADNYLRLEIIYEMPEI